MNKNIGGFSMEITQNINESLYHKFGFGRAGEAQGMPDAFSKTLPVVEQQARNEILQSRIHGVSKEDAQEKLKDCTIRLEQIQQGIISKKGLLRTKQKKIEELEKELRMLKTNPDKLLGNDIEGNAIHKIYFWICLIGTILLSIYIFFFYNSAGYSAIFKDFTVDDTKIIQAIFDSQALSSMFSEGVGGLMLLLVFPFLFIAAGSVIHLLTSSKKLILQISSVAVILFSLIWDVILAYNITKKIDDVRIGNLVGEERANAVGMTLKTAVFDVNFWTIIFAGFVAYMILSFVFYFCMDFKYKLNIVHNEKEARQEEVKNCEKVCDKTQTEIQGFEIDKIAILSNIKYYKEIITGVRVKIENLLPALNGFYTGWIACIENSDFPSEHIFECKNHYESYIKQLKKTELTNIQN
jgi:peptidoglycan hydrolase CwlO-like protein